MKRKIALTVAGVLIFYIGAEIGYRIAYDNITCTRLVPSNGQKSIRYL
jgi:hypothetical protein